MFLVWTADEGMMQVFVTTPDGIYHAVEVRARATFADVIQMVQEQGASMPRWPEVTLHGELQRTAAKLADAGVCAEAHVHIRRGGAVLKVYQQSSFGSVFDSRQTFSHSPRNLSIEVPTYEDATPFVVAECGALGGWYFCSVNCTK